MTNRLLVNAGTPQAWEIQLRPGLNRIGRGEHNDFVIPHPSVSGSHCEITVSPGSVVLKDLSSTNGSFVNGAPVQEVVLQSGQALRLGHVELLFETVGAAAPAIRISVTPAASPPPAPAAPPPGATAPAIRITKPGLSISKPATLAPVAVAEVAGPPPLPTGATATGGLEARDMGVQFCRFHKTIHAHFHCDHCQKSFCDLCVNTRQDGDALVRSCRTCGAECVPLVVKKPKAVAKQGFFSSLPGALIYPLKGTGILIIVFSAIIFAALEHLANPFGFGILFIIAALGYLFSYSQNVIHATAAEEKDMPEMPGFDDLFGGCMRLLTCVGLSFGLPLILLIANVQNDLGVPNLVLLGLAFLGCFYFPMCFLAVAMKDTVAAANPLFVLPSILKVPLEYIVAAGFFLVVISMWGLGKLIAMGAGFVTTSTRDMNTFFLLIGFRVFWTFASVYLLTVSMRVLGLLYVSKKSTLGWFPR